MDPDECPHLACEFVDVTFSNQFQFEQRYHCLNCLAWVHLQMGPFGTLTNRRVVMYT
jgi:hypothetical protein